MTYDLYDIDHHDILEGFKESFVLSSIYRGAPVNHFKVVTRPLSHNEKKLLLDTFLDVFFINFFHTKGNRTFPSFLGNRIKLCKERVGGEYMPVVKWISEDGEKQYASIKITFENAKSELICNLVSEYTLMNDMGLLEDIE